MTETEAYLFDLDGYLIIRDALTGDEVKALNELIDEYKLEASENRIPEGHYHAPLAVAPMLRSLMNHPVVFPYVQAWTSDGRPSASRPRLDHSYFIFNRQGGTGQKLHLGGTPYVPSCSYHVRDGRIFSALTVVSFVLNEVPRGQGGFACIPGSHKSKFPCPRDFTDLQNLTHVTSPEVQPGDAIIFTEALTHGSTPWTAAHTRRALFYKYAPAHMAWMRPRWSEELLAVCTPAQRALLAPPEMADHPEFF